MGDKGFHSVVGARTNAARVTVESLTPGGGPPGGMSSDGGGLMSSAGLVRYFDAEDQNAIRVDPKTIVAFGALFGIAILVLNVAVV